MKEIKKYCFIIVGVFSLMIFNCGYCFDGGGAVGGVFRGFAPAKENDSRSAKIGDGTIFIQLVAPKNVSFVDIYDAERTFVALKEGLIDVRCNEDLCVHTVGVDIKENSEGPFFIAREDGVEFLIELPELEVFLEDPIENNGATILKLKNRSTKPITIIGVTNGTGEGLDILKIQDEETVPVDGFYSVQLRTAFCTAEEVLAGKTEDFSVVVRYTSGGGKEEAANIIGLTLPCNEAPGRIIYSVKTVVIAMAASIATIATVATLLYKWGPKKNSEGEKKGKRGGGGFSPWGGGGDDNDGGGGESFEEDKEGWLRKKFLSPFICEHGNPIPPPQRDPAVFSEQYSAFVGERLPPSEDPVNKMSLEDIRRELCGGWEPATPGSAEAQSLMEHRAAQFSPEDFHFLVPPPMDLSDAFGVVGPLEGEEEGGAAQTPGPSLAAAEDDEPQTFFEEQNEPLYDVDLGSDDEESQRPSNTRGRCLRFLGWLFRFGNVFATFSSV